MGVFRLLVILTLFLGSCNLSPPLLSMTGTIALDGVGGPTSLVRVNFLTCNPVITNQTLQLLCTNPEGDQITLTLQGSATGFSQGNYSIGTAASLEVNLTVFVQNTINVYAGQATEGFINLASLTVAGGNVSAMSGQFQVNFPDNGTATGIFNTAGQ